ncbi:MAG: 23S rRNA (adenine(2503)-C(2))-methyltransferase RlmN [Anaerofustis stercorihominis]|nr:23S rRNA (adenine(2503)-C(2))-methyltransferase RlmN [Anaerofustis stercorihominis]
MKKSLAGMTLAEMEAIVTEEFNEPKFRAKQLYEWVYKAKEINEMTNLPKKFRDALQLGYDSFALESKSVLREAKSETEKYLLRTKDDIIIEAVLLRYEHGNCVCVSTQAGCGMHCKFCASGKNGLLRNLTAGEIISEVLVISRLAGVEITNIVLMGSGEPLNNYENVKKFIQLCNDEKALNISIRKITLSTCGIIPGIRKMIEDSIFVNLSVSLHSPVSEMRLDMMPAEKAYPIADVVKACEEYRQASKRRITYEYCVIEGLNDTDECADRLYELIGESDALINLIDVNSGSGAYAQNTKGVAENFKAKLDKRKINATLRRKLGSSINAACGQLKSQYERDIND